jgi:adenosylcobinamide-phosphate synthase
MARDHGRTASPNAGWTMAAMAGALAVTLHKPAAYRLGRGPLPEAADIERSIAIVSRAAGLALLAMIVLLVCSKRIVIP